MAMLLATPKIGYAKGLRNMEAKATAVHKSLTAAETAATAREAAVAQAAAEAAAAASAQAAVDAQADADQRAAQSQPYVAPYVEPYVAPAAPEADNYTGCRAYGSNGTSVDKKGRRYTKIPCP